MIKPAVVILSDGCIEKKHIALLALFQLLCLCGLLAQESSVYENYYLNPFLINPAIAGAEYYPTADLSVKRQWMGFPDAPATFLLTGCYRVGKYGFYDPRGFVNKGPLRHGSRIGLGASLFSDKDGPLGNTGAVVSYAYHIPVNVDSRLSLGLSAIGTYHTFNTSLLNPDDPNDPYLLTGNEHVFRANFCLGAYFYHEDYFIGISADKLLPDKAHLHAVKKEQPSFFLIGGYKFFRHTNSILFEPSFAVKKIAGNDLSADIHAKLYIRKLNWVALSYSTTQKINFRFGLKLYEMLYAGYNYEFMLGDIARYQYGSHEIHLGVNLGLIGITRISNRM